MQHKLSSEQIAILELLCSSQEENIALAKQLAISQGINLVDFLKFLGYDKLWLAEAEDFMRNELYLTTYDVDGWNEYLPQSVTNLIITRYPKPLLPKLSLLNLKALDCSNNKIIALPNNLSQNLAELYCNNNQITNLPNNLPHNLIRLYCRDNQITSLPNNLPLNLQELDCSYNQIVSLSNNFFPNLAYLNCSSNQIVNLPDNLSPNLKELDCSNNQITHIPQYLIDRRVKIYHEGNPIK